MKVAIVHDYLTQRGGAERVVLSIARAFPGAPIYTSFYEAETTFPEFAMSDVRTLRLDAIRPLRRNHRAALPLLAPAFSRCTVSADVVLCSSSGWAHGVKVDGRKVVYCHTPARWLYQPTRYLGQRHVAAAYALKVLRPYLLRWDRKAAHSAQIYLANSSAVAERIRAIYGIEPGLLLPPHAIDPSGPMQDVPGLCPGFVLCVSRLLPYKNLEPLVQAFAHVQDLRLVVVGTGPERGRLGERAPGNVRFLGSVSDEQLRWLYSACTGLVAASYEDYGLTPLEAAAFGKPAAVLRWGGFLDTVIEGRTGVFFDRPEPALVASAVRTMVSGPFSSEVLRSHADRFSEQGFISALRREVGVSPGGSDV